MKTRHQIALIRQFIAQGMDNAEIQDALQDAQAAEQEHRDRYGDEREDERSPAEKQMCDRLDMGRNEAGEWLGFC